MSDRTREEMLRRAAEGSLDEVLALLADRHGAVRLAAARGILARFPESAEALYPLLFDSAEVNAEPRGGCVPPLSRPLGEVVLELLTRASAHESAAVRSTLDRALQDERLGTRRYAHLFAASSRGVPALRSAVALALEALHSSDDPDVRVDATAMLGRAPLDQLAAIAGDSDPVIRETAARALKKHAKSESDARVWLARLSQDPNRRVREAVAASLRCCASDPVARAALEELAVDPDEIVRETAVAALGEAGPAARGAGRDKSPGVRAAAVEGLIAAGGEAAIRRALEMIEREECPPVQALHALRKLSRVNDPQVLAFARRLVAGRPDELTRGCERPFALPSGELTPRDVEWLSVAISIIGAQGDGSDTAALEPHLSSRSDLVASAAERALRRLSGR